MHLHNAYMVPWAAGHPNDQFSPGYQQTYRDFFSNKQNITNLNERRRALCRVTKCAADMTEYTRQIKENEHRQTDRQTDKQTDRPRYMCSNSPHLVLWIVTRPSTSFAWGKGGNVTSVGWQVTLCDPIRHASSRSGVAG